MMTHRPIQEHDAEIICGFAQTAEELFYMAPHASFPWDTEKFSQDISKRLSNTVFLVNQSIIGFANIYDAEFGVSGFIGNVVINPQYRRKGWGKIIVQHMLVQGFNEHQFNSVRISCFSTNQPALQLYKNMGFIPYDTQQRTDYKNEPIELLNLIFTKDKLKKENQTSSSIR